VQSLGSILLIEDDQYIREFMRTLLEDEGYEVQQVSNGLEALDLLSSYSPKLIWLNLDYKEVDFRDRSRMPNFRAFLLDLLDTHEEP
jgi:DNA-binding response OmpR family regulator